VAPELSNLVPATPPVQSHTAAYTQVGPMDPSHSRPFIDTQLGPRHPGQDTQTIHTQSGPAPIEQEYTGQPSVDSQPSLSMSVDDIHLRQSYDSSHMYTYGPDTQALDSMSAYTHMPYTQSALRDVDPSRPAYTHIHCRKDEAAAQVSFLW